jgi:hypothetical protein
MGILENKIRSCGLTYLLLLLLLLSTQYYCYYYYYDAYYNFIVKLLYYISHKGLIEECNKLENVAVTVAVTASVCSFGMDITFIVRIIT